MISVTRSSKPAILEHNESKWRSEYLSSISELARDSSELNKKKKNTAENRYRNLEIKDSLETMFHKKCAFCESNISHISYSHIEHFKPKIEYPDLCFNWDNLLLSCAVCNQTKAERFPIEHGEEVLINPCQESDLSQHFKFVIKPETKTAEVVPLNHRGKTSELIYGLNRVELIKVRSELVAKIAIIAVYASRGDEDAKEILLSACSAEKQFSAFATTIAKQVGLLP